MRSVILLFFPIFCFATCLPAQETDYRVVSNSRVTIEQGGEKQHLVADSEFDYARTAKDKNVVLQINSVKLVAKANDSILRDIIMDKSGAKNSTTGKQIAASNKEAFASFGEPLMQIILDENGSETSRKFLVDESSLLIKSGDYQYANLFHSGFNEKGWTEKFIYPATGGITISGNIQYKVVSKKGEQTKVEFSGVLDDDFKLRGLDCKNVKYEITGSKSYDSTKKIWTIGNMKVKLNFDMFLQGAKIMSMNGTVDFEFEVKTKK